jgi:phage repressor protein C with HTH and peptisase S24 domain
MDEIWRQRLRDAVERSGRTHDDVAYDAGISTAALEDILSGADAQPDFETVVRIIDAAGETLGALAGTVALPNAVRAPFYEIPKMFADAGATLVYQAAGDTMTGRQILDGDYVFVKPERDVATAHGRVVVCRFEGAEYVKVLIVHDGGVFLVGTDESSPVIPASRGAFELIGIVIGRGGELP